MIQKIILTKITEILNYKNKFNNYNNKLIYQRQKINNNRI